MRITIIKDVKTPTRGTEKSAGIDFYIPNDFPPFLLGPREGILIGSGIKAQVPPGFMLMAADKSGVCTRTGVIIGAKIVDEDYQGEIHIHLINTSSKAVRFNPGEKITQFILVPVSYGDIEVVDHKDLFAETSERGEGGFGSTGK